MPYFELPDKVKIYYERYGKGRPIVFIHPPLMGHVVFKYQIELIKKYEVIFYDCRGHGKSTYCESNHSNRIIETHIEDLKKLLIISILIHQSLSDTQMVVSWLYPMP